MSPSTLTLPDMNAAMTAAWSWETKAARAIAYSIDRLTSAVASRPSSSVGCPLLVSRWASIVPPSGASLRRRFTATAVPSVGRRSWYSSRIARAASIHSGLRNSYLTGPHLASAIPSPAAGAAVACPPSGAAHRSGRPTIVDHVSAAVGPAVPVVRARWRVGRSARRPHRARRRRARGPAGPARPHRRRARRVHRPARRRARPRRRRRGARRGRRARRPPTPTRCANVLRADVRRRTLDRDEVLAQAPAAEDGRFRVPAILGEEP